MEWKRDPDGHWTRHMDGIERFFHAASSVQTPCGIAHTMVSVGATLPVETHFSITDFQAAWRSLRFHHPRIACSIFKDSLQYSTPNKNDEKKWLTETLLVDESGANALDLLGTLRSSTFGVLVLLPQSREVFFQISHAHIDGMGAMLFLNCLFEAIENPVEVQFGDEYRNLSNSVAHNIYLEQPNPASTRWAQKVVRDFASNLPGVRLDQIIPPKTTYAVCMERVKFTQSETKQIRLHTREKGITITHACHSALIQALSQSVGVEGKAYASLFYFNLRPPFTSRSADSPVSVYLTALPAVVPANSSSDFRSLALDLQKIYKGGNIANTSLHRPLYEALVPVMEASGDGQIRMSSLGVVDERIHCKLEDFWIGAGSATADMTTYVWTFQGCLTVATWFNDAFYQKQVVIDLLKKLQSALLLGLGL
jgi:hypothetical protein